MSQSIRVGEAARCGGDSRDEQGDEDILDDGRHGHRSMSIEQSGDPLGRHSGFENDRQDDILADEIEENLRVALRALS